jgi:Holliday junction resolvasome RuvABC endonuclease subunit
MQNLGEVPSENVAILETRRASVYGVLKSKANTQNCITVGSVTTAGRLTVESVRQSLHEDLKEVTQNVDSSQYNVHS